jgi:hypothetical protein
MQLRFTLEERQLLADILEELDFKLRSASRNPNSGEPAPLDNQVLAVEGLLDQVIDAKFEFGCDELDRLVEVLTAHKRKLEEELRNAANGSSEDLQRKRRLLQSILDKVIEACAMA